VIGFFEAFIVGVIDLQAGQGLQLAAVQTTVARTQFPIRASLQRSRPAWLAGLCTSCMTSTPACAPGKADFQAAVTSNRIGIPF